MTGAQALAGAAPPQADTAKVWQAAHDFVDSAHSTFGGGEAEAAWRPMLIDAIGKQMAQHGGIGLAIPVFNAMLRAQEQTR